MRLLAQKPKFMAHPWVRFAASIRLAIPTLFLFALAMAAGTICESLYGTEFARRAIYQTWWFALILLSIAVSLTLAMLDRIPLRKRLAGFYLVHISLLIIMGGSVVTRYYGIDGSIELKEGEFTSNVRIDEDHVYVWDGSLQQSFKLPDSFLPTDLNAFFRLNGGAKAFLVRFLPYAEAKPNWIPMPGGWATSWLLKNERFEQRIDLFDRPGSPAAAELGPLKVEVAPWSVVATLQQLPQNDAIKNSAAPPLLLFDSKLGRAYPIPAAAASFNPPGTSLKISRIVSEKLKLTYYELTGAKTPLKFFPRFSTRPVTNHLEISTDTTYTLIDLTRYSGTNCVLLARFPDGKIRAAMGKQLSWSFAELNKNKLTLPWMGFTLTLLEEHVDQQPVDAYASATPNREDEKNMHALLMRLEKDGQTQEVWLTNREAAKSPLGLEEGFIGPKEMKLPFSMSLERFKMDLIPGSDKPASYESFVKIKGHPLGLDQAHVYMNNPLKTQGFTFYQSSYYKGDDGSYRSILSVNRDPGRPIKYAGSLLLVAALILHFSILYGYIKVDS